MDLLPSLLYFLTAAVILTASRRFVMPFSAGAALALAALPLLFVGPALVTGRVTAPIDLPFMGEPLAALGEDYGVAELHGSSGGDIAFQIIPFRQAVRHAFAHGEWPLWNPFMMTGTVASGNAQTAPFHPVHLLGLLLPLGLSFTFSAAVFLLLAGVGAFCLARDLDCRESAALIAAAGWAWSSFSLHWLHWPLGQTMVLLPLVWLGARRTARCPGVESGSLLVVIFVLVLLAGHPETAFHVVMVGALWGLAELSLIERRGAAAGAAFAAGLAALALTAFFLFPFLDALVQSEGFLGRRDLAGVDVGLPWGESLARLRTAVLPFAYGLPWSEVVPHSPHFVPLSSAYAGSVLLVPALLALGAGRGRARFLLAGFVVMGVSLGASAPGLTDLLARLPLFDIAINRRMVAVAACALALLAALGTETFCRSFEKRGGRQIAITSVVVGAGLGLLVAWLWPALQESGLTAGFLRQQAILLVVAPLLAALVGLVRRPQLGVALLLLLLAAQRFAEAAPVVPSFSPEVFYPRDKILRALPHDGSVYRVVGQGAALLPNISALYELDDPRGYAAMTFAPLPATQRLWSEPPGGIYFYNRVETLDAPFLDFLNVRYAIVSHGTPFPGGWERVVDGRGSRLFENPNALERAFVPRRVRFGVPEDKVVAQMSRQEDFSQRAWIDGGTRGDGESREERNGRGEVLSIDRRGTRYLIDVRMKEPGWMVVSETAWRGWRAVANDEELRVTGANRAFLAVYLPAGKRQVVLFFRPRSFEIGLGVSSAALLLLLGGVAYRRFVRA